MADRNKFEQMLELLVNEDKAAAEKLFHEIVVEKSRDIYEGLLEDDKDVDEATDEEVDEASDEEVDETTDEEVDEASDEEVDEATDEEVEENFNLDEFEVEADPADMGGDATDDMMSDLGMDDEGGEGDDDMGDAEDDAGVEDRVEDLEDALDDLKAEFEKMMAGDDEGEDDMGGDEPDMDADDGEEEPEEAFAFETSDEEVDEASDEEVDEASDEEVKEKTKKTAGEEMREYVEKVSAKMGDNGANTKSSIANPNNMGGTAGNLNQGSEENGGDHTGLGDASPKDLDGGNINVPGGKASKSLKAQPGHGAEKKGKPEAAADKKSLIGGK